VDTKSGDLVSEGDKFVLSSEHQEVQQCLEAERRFTFVLSGLRRSCMSFQGGKFVMKQTECGGIYEIKMLRNESSVVEDSVEYITGSSEVIQFDMTIGGLVSVVSLGDRPLLSASERFAELKVRLSSNVGEKVHVRIF
jgi:hypothetical protein